MRLTEQFRMPGLIRCGHTLASRVRREYES